jgi:hypothetical protein
MFNIKKSESKIDKKINDFVGAAIIYIFNSLFVALKFSFRAILKELIRLTKKLFKKELNNKIVLIHLSLLVIIAIILIILKLGALKAFLFAALVILFIRGSIFEFKLIIESKKRQKMKITYKRLTDEIFKGKISIIDIDSTGLTVFSNELTTNDLLNNKDKFELYFNKDVEDIKRLKQYRYNKIIFANSRNFAKYYKFEDCVRQINIKEAKKHEIPFLIGVDEAKKVRLGDLSSIKNMLIAGEPGGGKSVWVNSFIQSSMILNHNIVYIMIDLKQGVELSEYNKFKNCIICKDINEFKNVISIVKQEMIKRLQLIRETDNCKSIKAYNAKKGLNLNYYMVLIDEIAMVKLGNKGKSGKSPAEIDLVEIGNQGRAAGVFLEVATQRPSADQIDTDFKAALHKSISFCVSTAETQRMTKIKGTEKLGPGEFKTTIFNDTSKVWKSPLVLEEADKKAKLPYSNEVYENLKHVIVNNKELITIKDKKPKQKNLHFLQKMFSNKNKGYDGKLANELSYENLIKPVSKSVEDDVKRIKKQANIFDISGENHINDMGNNYLSFLKFVKKEASPKTGLLPNSRAIMAACGLTSDSDRQKLLSMALNDGYIEKGAKTRFKIKLGPIWDNI